ncbi:hypothetical protein MTR_1g090035 [Medicago truncatula]|uniref:Uncharacterized protein n=1 Tax=Medicago truncatula TaxID=3880 RepID=A0A072VMQ0_MEDTR|nr:hypothetical protein MTR_1g090035 [Medicago truncatula]
MAEGNSGADIHRILAAVKSSEARNLSLKEASESDHASVMNCLVVSFLHLLQCLLCSMSLIIDDC